MVQVPDAASLAAMRAGSAVLGRRVGGSTGTNLWGAFGLIAEMLRRRADRLGGHPDLRRRGPLRRHVLRRRLGGRRQGLDLAPHLATIDRFLATGELAGLTGSRRPGGVAQRASTAFGQARVAHHVAVRVDRPGRR